MAAFTISETNWGHDAVRLGAVRRAVFIDEQAVPEVLEWDEYDVVAMHWLALAWDGSPIGCARLLPDGHLGRMAVLPSAQTHAAGFYADAGFVADGPAYEEAGIPHVAMQKTLI